MNSATILCLLMQRIYARLEPTAVMTLPWTASRVDPALHLLDRVRMHWGSTMTPSAKRDLVARIMRARIACEVTSTASQSESQRRVSARRPTSPGETWSPFCRRPHAFWLRHPSRSTLPLPAIGHLQFPDWPRWAADGEYSRR